MPRSFQPVLRWIAVVGFMIVPTWLLLGPTGGFHHMIGFGPFPFFYMVWNGEDPSPGSFQIIEGYEVEISPILLAVVLLLWLAVLAGVLFLVRPVRRGKRPGQDIAT